MRYRKAREPDEAPAAPVTALSVGLLLGAAAVLRWFGTSSAWLVSGTRRTPSGPGPAGPPGQGHHGIRDPALMLDLAAAMLSAGRPPNTVLLVLADSAVPPLDLILQRVVTALELGSPWDQAWDLAERAGTQAAGAAKAAAVLRDALAFAASSGAPSAAVLHAQAAQIRRRRSRDGEQRAAALGIHLVLPLGLCALPAFLCFTVVPLLLALLPQF